MKTSKGVSIPAYQDDQEYNEGENNYRQQLEDIYQFCSKSFKLKINSPGILFETINALIKDMKMLKKENDKMKVNAILNNQDIFSSSELEENDDESDKSKAKSEKIKIARYKKQMSQMQQLIIDQQTKISDYDTKLQEMNLTIKNFEIQNKRYEQEISLLKKEIRDNKSNYSSKSIDNKAEEENGENNMVESVVKIFEDLIKSQSEEVVSLSDQRNKLSNVLHQSDQVLIQMETEYQTLQSQNEATIASLKSSQIQSNQDESIFPTIIEEIHELGVQYPQISKSESNHDFIIETITNILKSDKEQPKEKEKENDSKVSREQYETVLEQLESSMKFIQNIANASPILDKSSIQQPLYIDSISRTILLTQCARIGQFIDRNSLFSYSSNENPRISIFDPRLLQDPEQFLKPLLENASEELMAQSPTRELYTLFVGISEVNKMLLNYIEHFENKMAYDKDVENSEREIEDVKAWKAEQENKIRAIAQEIGMLNVPLEDVLDNFLTVYLDTVQENNELQKELQNDRENSDKKDFIDVDTAEIKQQLDDVEAKVLREKEKHKKEVSQLKKELAKYKEKCDQLAESLQKSTDINENKKRKYKKTKQALINLKNLVDEVEEKVQNVSEDNAQLNSTIESLNDKIKQQNSDITKFTERIKKLQDQKNNLSDKLRESKEKNEATLTGIKNRSEMLNEKYSTTIKNLENEIQNARQEAKNAEEEKAKILAQKNDLSNQLVKLRVTERSLKIKLDALENRNSLNKKENEQVKSALVRSIKAEASMKIEKSRDEYEKLKNALLRMLREKFNITFNKSTLTTPLKTKKKREISSSESNNTINSYFTSDNNSNSGSLQNEDLFDDSNTIASATDFIENSLSVDEIIQKVENVLQSAYENQDKLNELKETKNMLNIPESESLSKAVKTINDSLKELMKQNAEFRTNSDNVRLKCAEVDRKRNEQEKAIRAAAEWEQWSKSILYRITEGTSAIRSTKDVRFLLEEALLSTIGRRGILTKLDILKAEKKIFLNFASEGNLDILNLNAFHGPDAPPQPLLVIKIGSIRPMMVAIMFIRRIQVMSHRLPVRLSPFQRRDESESMTLSDQ